MNFKKWVKSIQTAGYNGARTVALQKSNNIVHANLINNKGGCRMHACNNFSGCAKKSEIYFDDQWDLNDNILYLNQINNQAQQQGFEQLKPN